MEAVKTNVPHALSQIYKNMKMGESSILDVMKKVEDPALRADLLAHLEGYQGFSAEAKELLKDEKTEAKEENAFTKLMAKMGVTINTMMDSTSSHLAEMVIEGSTMGVTDTTRILHELETVTDASDPDYEKAVSLAKRIISFEEKNIEKMKPYL